MEGDIEAETMEELAKFDNLEDGEMSDDESVSELSSTHSFHASDDDDDDDDAGKENEDTNEMFMKLSRRLSAREIVLDNFAAELSELDSLAASVNVNRKHPPDDEGHTTGVLNNNIEREKLESHNVGTSGDDDNDDEQKLLQVPSNTTRDEDSTFQSNQDFTETARPKGVDDEISSMIAGQSNMSATDDEKNAERVADQEESSTKNDNECEDLSSETISLVPKTINDEERQKFLMLHKQAEAEATMRAEQKRAFNRQQAQMERDVALQETKKKEEQMKAHFEKQMEELEQSKEKINAAEHFEIDVILPNPLWKDIETHDSTTADGYVAQPSVHLESMEKVKREELRREAERVEMEMETLSQKRAERAEQQRKVNWATDIIQEACTKYMRSSRRMQKINAIVIIQAAIRGSRARKQFDITKRKKSAVIQLKNSISQVKSVLLCMKRSSESTTQYQNNEVMSIYHQAIKSGCSHEEVDSILTEYDRLVREAREHMIHTSITDTFSEFKMSIACATYLGIDNNDNDMKQATSNFKKRENSCRMKIEEFIETSHNENNKSLDQQSYRQLILDNLLVDARSLNIDESLCDSARQAHDAIDIAVREGLIQKLYDSVRSNTFKVYDFEAILAEAESHNNEHMAKQIEDAKDIMERRICDLKTTIKAHLSLVKEISSAAAAASRAASASASASASVRNNKKTNGEKAEYVDVHSTIRHARLAGLDDEAEVLMSTFDDCQENLYNIVHDIAHKGNQQQYTYVLGLVSCIIDLKNDKSIASSQKAYEDRQTQALLRLKNLSDDENRQRFSTKQSKGYGKESSSNLMKDIIDAANCARTLGLQEQADKIMASIKTRQQAFCITLRNSMKTTHDAIKRADSDSLTLDENFTLSEELWREGSALGLETHIKVAEMHLKVAKDIALNKLAMHFTGDRKTSSKSNNTPALLSNDIVLRAREKLLPSSIGDSSIREIQKKRKLSASISYLVDSHLQWKEEYTKFQKSEKHANNACCPSKKTVLKITPSHDMSFKKSADIVTITKAMIESSVGTGNLLSSIENLDLSFEMITDIATSENCREDVLSKLDSLKSLILSSNSLSTLDGLWTNGRSESVKLERLIVNDNHLVSMSSLAYSTAMKSLSHLSLSCNNLTAISGLTLAPNLTSLILSSNRLESLEGVGFCHNLLLLDVSVNNITHLGDSLRSLPKLQSLDISFNRLTAVSDTELRYNHHLTSLNISENRLRNLPSFTGNVNLKEVHANVNSLTALSLLNKDARCVFLPFLETLEVSDNQIRSINGLSLLGCPTLKRLNLSFNRLSDTDDTILQLCMGCSQLQHLKLNDNTMNSDSDTTPAPHEREEFENKLGVALPSLIELDNDKFEKGGDQFMNADINSELARVDALQRQVRLMCYEHFNRDPRVFRKKKEEDFGCVDSFTNLKKAQRLIRERSGTICIQPDKYRQLRERFTLIDRIIHGNALSSGDSNMDTSEMLYPYRMNNLLNMIDRIKTEGYKMSTEKQFSSHSKKITPSTVLDYNIERLFAFDSDIHHTDKRILQNHCAGGSIPYIEVDNNEICHSQQSETVDSSSVDNDTQTHNATEIRMQSSTLIQRMWRGYNIRKQKLISKMRREIEIKVEIEREKRRQLEAENERKRVLLSRERRVKEERERYRVEMRRKLEEEEKRKIQMASQQESLLTMQRKDPETKTKAATKINALIRGFLIRCRLRKALSLQNDGIESDDDMSDFPLIDESFYAPPPNLSLDALPMRQTQKEEVKIPERHNQNVQYQYYDPNPPEYPYQYYNQTHTSDTSQKIRVEPAGPSTSSTVTTISTSPVNARYGNTEQGGNVLTHHNNFFAMRQHDRKQLEQERRANELASIMKEWGFQDISAAQAFLNSRKKQRNQKKKSEESRKMKDPAKRLEKFYYERERNASQARSSTKSFLTDLSQNVTHAIASQSSPTSSNASGSTTRMVRPKPPSTGDQSISVRPRTHLKSDTPKGGTSDGKSGSRIQVSSTSKVRIIRDNRGANRSTGSKRIAWA